MSEDIAALVERLTRLANLIDAGAARNAGDSDSTAIRQAVAILTRPVEEPDHCPKCKDYVGRCGNCGRPRPSIEETRRALDGEPRA